MILSAPKTLLKAMLYCLILLNSFTSVSQYIIKEDSLPQNISLHQVAQIADVGNSEMSFAEMLSSEKNLKFKKLPAENTDLGFTDHNFWVKFEIANTTAKTKQYFLETARPITDVVEFFSVSDNEK